MNLSSGNPQIRTNLEQIRYAVFAFDSPRVGTSNLKSFSESVFFSVVGEGSRYEFGLLDSLVS